MRGPRIIFGVVLLLVVPLAVLGARYTSGLSASKPFERATSSGGEERAGVEEGEEEQELTAERLEAFAEAKVDGRFTGTVA
jgi:hypothetical protein